jgi:hypothetical protein
MSYQSMMGVPATAGSDWHAIALLGVCIYVIISYFGGAKGGDTDDYLIYSS